jgi:hypothetical protein
MDFHEEVRRVLELLNSTDITPEEETRLTQRLENLLEEFERKWEAKSKLKV